MNLLISLRSEILKSKKTSSFYLALAAAAFAPFMSMLDIFLDEGISTRDQTDILSRMFIQKFQMTGGLVFPFFIILVCTLLPQIEYRNNAWKQVLTSPQSKLNVFFAKFISVHRLIIIFLVANHIFVWLVVLVLHFSNPSLHVLSQPYHLSRVLLTLFNSYVALLGLSAIQFWLGLRFRNFIIPIAIGIACWFTGTILALQVKPPFIEYFPYTHHAYPNFDELTSQIDKVHWLSLGYAVLFLVIGFWDFKKRRMNG